VGDEMRRGISGGEKKRLTTGMKIRFNYYFKKVTKPKNNKKILSYSREDDSLLQLLLSILKSPVLCR